jgi:ectoine hydroxylase-related dioxygenase (phytanoyl-CoA dioxygenase family)
VCNSIWLLDAFTEENGATRVVPGSHRWGKRPGDVMTDTTDQHPDEVLLLGEAGTCVVFNAHLWHGGTENKTDRPRRALHAAFVRREHRQQTVQRDYLRPETVKELTSAQRYLLEV